MISLDFLGSFSFFNHGILGAMHGFIIWFLILYASARVYRPNESIEHVISFISPVILVSFILSFFGVPDILIGLVVVIGLFVQLKVHDKLPFKKWLILSLKILILLTFNNQFGPIIGNLLLYLLIAWVFIEGEINKRETKKNVQKKDPK